MKRLKDYTNYKAFEKSAYEYQVKINWWVGKEDNIISSYYHTDYDNTKMQDFLNNVQLVSAMYILGNREEQIAENSINLTKYELMLYIDMVEELIPKLHGKYRKEIYSGDFGIDEFVMKDIQKTQGNFNPEEENQFFNKELIKWKNIINSDLNPSVIFHLIGKRLKIIEEYTKKQL